MVWGKCAVVDVRVPAGFCLLLVAFGAPADEFEPAQYLQSKSQWPAAHQGAERDLEPLPPKQPVQSPLLELGERLFNDPGLSSDGTVSCASCHQSEHHFADVERLSPGIEGRLGARTTPMLRHVELWDVLFWDGRQTSLEALVEEPLRAQHEMASTPEKALQHIHSQADYDALSLAAFDDSVVTWPQVKVAMAAFMRAIDAPPTRYETFIQAITAEDFVSAEAAMTAQELQGLHLFRTKAGCVQCHNGALLSDQRLHNMGLTYYGRRFEDLGAYLITERAEDVGKFRTPSLRYLTERHGWMHNGLFDDLLGIVRMYAHGGSRPQPRGKQVEDPLFPQTTDVLQPFVLSKEEEQALVAFLEAL